MSQHGPYATLVESLKRGEIDRRTFLGRATALGVGFSAAVFSANAVAVAAAGGSKNGFALYPGQDGTPSASPVASPVAESVAPPAIGTESQTRGQDGELRIILWQAPTHASPHTSTGTKDYLAGSLVVEPLMHYLPDGTLSPNLITAVPSVENGLLSEDLSTVTFTLLEGVLWSDGEPFTANDIVFTWKWVTNTERTANLSGNLGVWAVIANIEAVDDTTAVVTFANPSAAWFDPFTGGFNGPIYPAHIFNDDPLEVGDSFLLNPIGTGPFVITSFSPNDQVTYAANENYREPNKPAFATVLIKGGGDAASAARSVLESGEYDYAWNLQVEPAVIDAMVQSSTIASLVADPGTSIERININFSDPNTEVDGQRSEMNTPNPRLSDPAVRAALNLSVPRDVIATEFYGELIPPTANILTGLPSFESPNTSWEFNIDKANQLLDEAGWVLDGDVRSKDGVELKLSYATSINQVRQKTQAVVKQAFEAIGVQVELLQVDSGIFFDSAAGNEQNLSHFYWDIDMYTSNAASPIPASFMLPYYAGPDRSNIAQKSNGWAGNNTARWVNDDYDVKFEALQSAKTFDEANALLIELNDLVIANVVVIPQVNRPADQYAIANKLEKANCTVGAFEPNFWNIANWNLVRG